MSRLPSEGAPFGRYDLVRIIGRGGMGVVFAAVQRDLQREVALKIMSVDLTDSDTFRNRFLREAQALARLDSPHIVRIYDAGEHEGWLYLATQLFPSGDLAQRLRTEGPLPMAEAIDLVAQVAEGVSDAHEVGLIHRDIKASNILLGHDRNGRLTGSLCDFGIAHETDSEHTKTVGVIGTVEYMAPERHEGAPATAASDVYSLGCLLWAAISGKAPWTGTQVKVALAHLSEPVPQLPDGPDETVINEVLRRSMAKKPADRHPSAEAFREHLLQAAAQSSHYTQRQSADSPSDPSRAGQDPGSDSTSRPASTIVVEPGSPEFLSPATAPGAPYPDPAAAAPESLDDTLLVGGGTNSPAPTLAAPPTRPARPPRRRNPKLALLLTIGLLTVFATVMLTVVYQTTDQSSGNTSAAIAAGGSTSASPSSDSKLAVPPAPTGTVTRGQLRVLFNIDLPAAPEQVETWELQRLVRRGDDTSWEKVYDFFQDRTELGGERACATLRVYAATADSGTQSPTTTLCGRSKPMRILLKDEGPCEKLDACRTLSVELQGFPSGRKITLETTVNGVDQQCVRTSGKHEGESVPCFGQISTNEYGQAESSWVNWSIPGQLRVSYPNVPNVHAEMTVDP